MVSAKDTDDSTIGFAVCALDLLLPLLSLALRACRRLKVQVTQLHCTVQAKPSQRNRSSFQCDSIEKKAVRLGRARKYREEDEGDG